MFYVEALLYVAPDKRLLNAGNVNINIKTASTLTVLKSWLKTHFYSVTYYSCVLKLCC